MSEDLPTQLARLEERSDALTEDDPAPRGALPALFRALRAASPDERVDGFGKLAERLGDRQLLPPTLELAQETEGEAALAGAVRVTDGRGAWCSQRQAAALLDVGSPSWWCRALQLLISDPLDDPTELAVEVDTTAFCAALQEVLRLRLGTPARRRCRTSADLARGALRTLVRVAEGEAEVQTAARAVLKAETRRAGKGEPALAMEALDALDRAPALDCVRLLHPLLGKLTRRKVETRAREVCDGAVERAGLSTDEVGLLTARTGGAEADGAVRVPLEEGGEALLRIGPDGEVVRAGDPPDREDERTLANAERLLKAEWEELARRFERALIDQRDWSLELWEAMVPPHPLLADLARRVVWEVRGADERTPCAWDGRFVDLFGDPVEVAADARIGLAHPARMFADDLELWRERALEAELRAPFAQVFRDACAPPAEEPWNRFSGREAYKDRVEAMARDSGWDGCPFMGSPPWDLRRTFPSQGVTVRARFEESKTAWRPTLSQRRAANRQAKKTGQKVKLVAPKEDRPRLKVSFVDSEGDDPVALAEATRDLERLTDPMATVGDLYLRAWQGRKWKDEKESWREVVLRYRLGSPARFEVRKTLIESFASRAGIELRLEDRFAILDQWVVELGTGLSHVGPPKDHLPTWKADELAAEGNADEDPFPFPFRREAEPETVEVVERVLGLARLVAKGGPAEDADEE